MRKSFVLGALFAAVLSLAGCSSKQEGSSDSDDSSSSSGTMKVLLSEEPTKDSALSIAFDKWEKETENKVKTIVIPYDDQLTKFPLMLKNKDVPDLVATERLTRIYPDEFIDLSKKMDTSIFDQTALKIINQNYTDDTVRATPSQYTVTCYYYNVDAFEKAGIVPPTEDDPWTLDELYENAEKLQKDGGVKYGFASDFSRARYDNLMYSNGGSMVEKNGDRFDITINSQENVDTLQKFVDENKAGVMPKVIWTGGSNDNPADYFQNGNVGIYLSGSWNYDIIYNNSSSPNFAVMPSPMGSKQKSVITGGQGLGIPTDAEKQNLAIDFLNWFYEEDNYKEYIQNDKGLSFVTGVDVEQEDEKVKKDYDLMEQEMQYVAPEFLVDEESSWRNFLDNEYRDYLKQAVSGEITPQEALDSFANDLSKKSDWKIKE